MSTKRFKDLFQFAVKSKFKVSEALEEGEYPFYTSSTKLTKRINNALYNEEAIIFGTGGQASIHHINTKFSTSTDCLVAITNQKDLNIRFVYYYFLGNMNILEKGFKGAGLKHISKQYIADIEIPIYTIDIQNKIVKILDKIYNLLEKRKKSIDFINTLDRSQFLNMFGDPITNKLGWDKKLFKHLAKLERGRFSPRPRNDPSYFGGNYPFIQTGDIRKSGYRLYNYSQTLNERGIRVSKEFKKGTILIAIVGATIGATTVLMIDSFTTDSVIGIKVNDNKLDNIFLERLLRFYKQPLLDKAPEAARANLNLKILNELKIIIPPLELQKKYRLFSENIEKQRNKLKESLLEIENLFHSAIQKVFNGQLNFNVSVEVDVILNEINIEERNDLSLLTKDIAYLQNFVDRLNEQDFENQELYDKAKHVAFQLLKEKEGNRCIEQEYSELSKSIKVVLK
jgi:type I restriction enzyme, S subunit